MLGLAMSCRTLEVLVVLMMIPHPYKEALFDPRALTTVMEEVLRPLSTDSPVGLMMMHIVRMGIMEVVASHAL